MVCEKNWEKRKLPQPLYHVNPMNHGFTKIGDIFGSHLGVAYFTKTLFLGLFPYTTLFNVHKGSMFKSVVYCLSAEWALAPVSCLPITKQAPY
jgi:hypothetical protein